MKNNKYFIIISATTILLFLLLLIATAIRLTQKPNQTKTEIKTTPFPTITKNIYQYQPTNIISPTPNITIISAQPENNTRDVPVTTNITFTFNQLDHGMINITANPQIVFSTNTTADTLTLTPTTQLQKNTVYVLTVRFNTNIPAYIYSFRTEGAPVDTFDFPQQRADAGDIIYAPDVYLARRTPYQAQNFEVIAELSNTTGNEAFTVTLTGTDKNVAKQEFLTWAQSTGLTSQQIQTLDIRYQ